MLSYHACYILALENPCHGSAVEGNEIEKWSRVYRPEALSAAIKAAANRVTQGSYHPDVVTGKVWYPVANRMELEYSANQGDPMLPGFKPATHHNIDANGRMMAAYYMERAHRREVFKVAGVPMPAELEAGCTVDEG